MFKKLARLDAGRRRLPELAFAHHNDNRPGGSLAAAAGRARPQRLVCRWQAGASGRLECCWLTEPVEEAEAPGPHFITGASALPVQAAGNAAKRGFVDGRAA